jgi:hypothetical protein
MYKKVHILTQKCWYFFCPHFFFPPFFFSFSAIDEALDKIAKTPANAYVIRKIRPLLPSYGGDYTGVRTLGLV